MTRHIFTLVNDRLLERAIECIRAAYRDRPGSRVEVKGPKRSSDQNGKLHAMLGDLADKNSVPALTAALSWKDPTDNSVYQELARAHVAEARKILIDARRSLYRLLAEDAPADNE